MKYESCWFCNSKLYKVDDDQYQCPNITCEYRFYYYPKFDKILIGLNDIGYSTNIIDIDNFGIDLKKIKIQKDCSSEEIISLHETLEVFI